MRPLDVGAAPLQDQTPLPETYVADAQPLGLPPLRGTQRADVAIIGGGVTGISTALHLRQTGATVIVLEAREVGWGGSGRAFGQIVPYAKHGDAHVLASFGPAWGERVAMGLAGGPDLVFGLIQQHGIACEQQRNGLIFAAHNAAAQPTQERRAAFWQARGADVTMLYDDALTAETGSRFYRAALFDKRGGTINPLAYVRGLARAVLRASGTIHENSRVTALQRQGDVWQVRTNDGIVLAPQVVLATDAYTDDLWPGLRQSIVPLRAYQLVSAPLSDNLRRSVLPGGQPLSDTRRLYSGIRMRTDGRLHLSVDGSAFGNDSQADVAMATNRVKAVFPHLPPPKWEHAVAGWVGMTADQYPHVHRLAAGLTAAVGLSGRGLAFGTLLGREISLRLTGRPEHEWMMPDTPLRPVRVKPFMRPLVGALMNWYRVLDGIELRRAR
jgi:glycine/D-amino acid oxidase-like deaminating enzyme